MSESDAVVTVLRLLEIVIGVVKRALNGSAEDRKRAHDLLAHLESDAAARAAQEAAARKFGTP